jgi:hypothetical protein
MLAQRSRRHCEPVHRRHPNQTFRDGRHNGADVRSKYSRGLNRERNETGAAQRRPGARPGRPGAAVSGRLLVNVMFDPLHDYVGTAPELRSPVSALSLNGLQGPSVPENRSPEHTLRRYLPGFCGAASGDEQMFGAK